MRKRNGYAAVSVPICKKFVPFLWFLELTRTIFLLSQHAGSEDFSTVTISHNACPQTDCQAELALWLVK